MKCWQKTLAFHEFYVQIESVHEAICKVQDDLSMPHETIKVEINEALYKNDYDDGDGGDNMVDTTFDENDWSFHNEPDENSSHDFLTGNIYRYILFFNESNILTHFCISDELVENKLQTCFPNITMANVEITPKMHVKYEKNSTDIQIESKKIPKSKSKYVSHVQFLIQTIFMKFSYNIFRKHKKASRGRPKLPATFICKIRMCLEEFDTIEGLVTHKTSVHRRIQCTHCPDVKLVVDLNKHLRTSHGIEQNSMCEHCGQVYTNQRSLQVTYIKEKTSDIDDLIISMKFIVYKFNHFRITYSANMRWFNHCNVIFVKIGLKIETQYERI